MNLNLVTDQGTYLREQHIVFIVMVQAVTNVTRKVITYQIYKNPLSNQKDIYKLKEVKMAYYEIDEGGKVVPATEVSEEVIRLIESMDDRAIIQRMTSGIAEDAFIYRYPIKTKTGVKEIIGISTDGGYELASMVRNLETLPDFKVDKDTDPDYIYAGVRVRNYATNVIFLGVGRQCKFMLDEGNKPIRDRLNEHAFVSAISKAQRNGILHHIKQELIIETINAWKKGGKSKQLRPPSLEVGPEKPKTSVATTSTTTKPATPQTATQDAIAKQQEILKGLRMEVHTKFERDLGINVERRKERLKEKFGVDSLLDLNEQQLRNCLIWIEELIQERSKLPSAKPATVDERASQVVALGFENITEQNKLRSTLYAMLTTENQLGLKDEDAKKFITNKGYKSTSEITKSALVEIIKEVDSLIKVKHTPLPETPQEELPF